jgi:pyruvate,water dikinase
MSEIIDFKDCSYKNKHLVGGKNSSLGELYNLAYKLNFNIADGFAITTTMFDNFIKRNNLYDTIENELVDIDIDNIKALELTSKKIIDLVNTGTFTSEETTLIENKYNLLASKYHKDILSVAIRSSAIAEDLPNASFAGQQDTYLNISGIESILLHIKKCFASLYNTRAISYRKTHNISSDDVKISVAVQKMVRSDLASAGVAFSIDPETGYDKAIVINSSFGLGELVVSGGVKPDEIICDKRTLNDISSDPIIMKKMGDKKTKIIYKSDFGTEEIDTGFIEQINYSINNNYAVDIARIVLLLEKEYSKMFDKKLGVDVEWAIDGKDRRIYILQTRPETIHSNNETLNIEKYILDEKSNVLITGVAVGEKISAGSVKILSSLDEADKFEKGDILVTDMTTPDWEPLMKKSSGIITNKGGRTCHAAIVAREMGLNAVVGTESCTDILKYGQSVTIFCADGEQGKIYDGKLKYHIDKCAVKNNNLPINLMLNVGNPETSFTNSLLPNKGVGLARLEFIINNYVKIHPRALIDYPNVPENLKNAIYHKLGDNYNGEWFFTKRLARGIAKIASAFYPNDVIVRFSDFKSNEYKNLIGGDVYEPNEENPMIGWRGASRYYSKEYERAFEMECEAIKYVRNTMKMTNVVVMIPFCRTVEECKLVIEKMEKCGLSRKGDDPIKVFLMCEIPSNVIEADRFSEYIDGVSIGGNDLLQLTLGVDRDSEKITYLSDNKNISYRRMISKAIKDYKSHNVKVGFCGQQPSDSLEFCQFLINEGIDSISVTADSVLKTINNLSI